MIVGLDLTKALNKVDSLGDSRLSKAAMLLTERDAQNKNPKLPYPERHNHNFFSLITFSLRSWAAAALT
jgi:hypothetical protein